MIGDERTDMQYVKRPRTTAFFILGTEAAQRYNWLERVIADK